MVNEISADPPLVAEHDTWISFDPVIGCPADCGYCYLGTLGLRARKPHLRIPIPQAVEILRGYLHGRRSGLIQPFRDVTPICIGNYTDMLMTESNRRILLRTVERLVGVLNPRPLVLITKAALTSDIVRELDSFSWPIVWFFSQSFAREKGVGLERGRIADFATTLANAQMVGASAHQESVHFWRPFVRELSSSVPDKADIVRRLKSAGMRCSVVVGMKRGDGVPTHDGRLHAYLRSGIDGVPDRSEVLDQDGWRAVAAAGLDAGYAIYRHSSCAVALVRRSGEQLGTWRTNMFTDRCLPCSCPEVQRRRCDGRASEVDEANDLDHFAIRTARFLGLDADLVSYDRVSGYLHIRTVVSEFDYNAILHASMGRCVPIARSVVVQKAWRGPLTSK